jgi:Zn-dependent protease with chaperone function
MVKVLLGVLLLLTNGGSVNFFSLKQDVEIGSESAKEAEQSLSLIRDPNLDSYFRTVGQRLVQDHSLPALRFKFRIVNSKEVNSLGFPGGAIYIYRGLVQVAANDDELAAILAHEIGHVASRHGTAQLTRQLIVQAPIAIAAGFTDTEAWKEQLSKLGISLGIDAPFLRYSRDQELEASLMAVRLMANARFDPNAFRTLLEKVNEAGTGETPRASAFVFNHPQSETVAPEIAEEIEHVTTTLRRPRVSPEFRAFQIGLQHLAYPAAKAAATDPPPDSISKIFTHPQDFYRLGYPDGWVVTSTGSNGAIIAPVDGVQSSRNGDDVTLGVMFDLFDTAVPDRSLTLEQATNRLIVYLRQRNQSLRIIPGAQTQTLVSDEPGVRTVMIGKDDSSTSSEVVWVVTRSYYQSLFYMVFVAPEDEFAMYQPVFEQMIRSVRLR